MNLNLTSRKAFLVLNALPRLGPVTMKNLLEVFGGDPAAVLGGAPEGWRKAKGVGPSIMEVLGNWRKHVSLEREEGILRQTGTDFITCRDAAYPALLREIYDPPIGLYWKGSYRVDQPCIALVGSRHTTGYGRSVAKKLAADLARRGFCVVSGLARGIDTAAHEGALSVGGKTVAVLGCGLDIIYPPENLSLYREIAATGAVVSEFPFGRNVDRQTFPMRNRIVAGMCEGVVVVESGVKGGSMITARFAGEHGRLLFAVPGRIDQQTSSGCHQLIRDGATLLESAADIVEELNYLDGLRPLSVPGEPESTGEKEESEEISSAEKEVLDLLGDGSLLHSDELAERTGRPFSELATILMVLELKRKITKRVDGTFEIVS